MADFLTNIMQANQLILRMASLSTAVEEAASELSHCINNGGVIYIIGNGGSASDASHFAGEIVGRFYKERKGLSCIALNTDIAVMTSIANDYGYDSIFERQLEAFFIPQTDILITMSTSGNSTNICRALDYLLEVGGKSINLLGKDGGIIADSLNNSLNSLEIIIPSYDTPRIQEMHMLILHYFAEVIEREWVNRNV